MLTNPWLVFVAVVLSYSPAASTGDSANDTVLGISPMLDSMGHGHRKGGHHRRHHGYGKDSREDDKYVKCFSTTQLPIQDSRQKIQPCITPVTCGSCSIYRTFDGSCNHLTTGFTSIGMAGTPFLRVHKARYADGKREVEQTTDSGRLPLARVISYTIFKDKKRPDHLNAVSVMEWGQLITHDTSKQEEIVKEGGGDFECCPSGLSEEDWDKFWKKQGEELTKKELDDLTPAQRAKRDACLPIELPEDDPFFSKTRRRCMDFTRSDYITCNTPSKRSTSSPPVKEGKVSNQINHVSSYIDASFLYGNNPTENQNLRTLNYGLLKSRPSRNSAAPSSYWTQNHHYDEDSGEFLPIEEDFEDVCIKNSESDVCYLAGDDRVNESPWLAVLQTVFLREHNRIARALRDLHPYWTDEVLFQEARRIVIAELQHITYEEYLPRVIGKEIIEKLHLEIYISGLSDQNDPLANPSTMIEFTSAAFRIQHSIIPGYIELDGEGRCPIKNLRLRDHIYNPTILEEANGNFDSLVRGMTQQPIEQGDRFFTSELTRHMREPEKPLEDDLESVDVQRGRDHGVPSYNDMRKKCGLSRAKDFSDLKDVMTGKSISILKKLYRSVNDVDLFVGGSLEENCVEGDKAALVGPTFGCIIGEQFWRWKFGDRFFLDNKYTIGAFTTDQFTAITKAKLSTLLCENLDNLEFIQANPFLMISDENPLMPCKNVPKLDLSPWKDYQPATCT